MQHRDLTEPDPEALPEPLAARLLARASELDTAGAAGYVSVADLRAAASEAGIAPSAFDAALAELRATGQPRAPEAPDVREQPPRRRRRWALAAAGAALIAAGALAVSRGSAPTAEASVAGVPTVDETYLLRCLSAVEAADVIRPQLTSQANAVRVAQGSRVVTVRATPAQQQQVKAVLEKYEGAGSPACATAPTGTAPR